MLHSFKGAITQESSLKIALPFTEITLLNIVLLRSANNEV